MVIIRTKILRIMINRPLMIHFRLEKQIILLLTRK